MYIERSIDALLFERKTINRLHSLLCGARRVGKSWAVLRISTIWLLSVTMSAQCVGRVKKTTTQLNRKNK